MKARLLLLPILMLLCKGSFAQGDWGNIISMTEIARANSHGIDFVDYYTPLVFGELRQLNPEFTTDGCHPTAEGYAIMEPIVHAAIQRAMK